MINISHKSKYKRYIEYPITGIFAKTVYYLLSITPFAFNSNLGSHIVSFIGPFLKEHKIAKENIKKTFPNFDNQQIDNILKNMWDNIGRTFFEYPKLKYIVEHGDKFIKIKNSELLDEIKQNKKPVIFISAHFGNWEIMRYLLVSVLKEKCAFIFRPPNNPYLADIFMNREKALPKSQQNDFPAVEKGLSGFKQLVSYMKNGYSLFSLIDQKLKEGVKINFLDRQVTAVPAPASLALRFDLDVYMVMMHRKNQTNFEISITKLEKPDFKKSSAENILKYTQIMNDHIAEVIKNHPEQWFWVHNRFK